MDPLSVAFSIGLALLFFILGRILPSSLKETDYGKRREAKKAFKDIEKLAPSGIINTIFRWHTFEAMMVYPICRFMNAYIALDAERLTSEYTEEPKALPVEISSLRTSYLPERIMEARKMNRKCDDDPAYSLDQIDLHRERKEEGRIIKIHLRFSPTSYYTFIMANLALDKPLLEGGQGKEKTSIRQKYDLNPDHFDPTNFGKIPLHLRFDVDIVLRTSDGQIVLPVRSSTQDIAPGSTHGKDGRQVVHVVGEAMLRSNDAVITGSGQEPNPFKTVIRALYDELLLDPMEHYTPNNIRCLAIYFDFERYQAVGVFTVPLNIDFKDLDNLWPLAKDHHEHSGMACVPDSPTALRELFDGRAFFRGKPLELASNHARMSLFLAMFYYHSYKSIEGVFRK